MADPNYNVFGTETNPIALAWRSLPPNVRAAYASVPNVLAELSPGAAVRDLVNESGNLTRNVLAGNGWGSAGAGAGMLTAMAGLMPGARVIGKAAELPAKLYHVAGPSYRAGNDLKPAINFMARRDAQDMFRQKWPEGDQSHINKLFFHDDLAKARNHAEDFGGTIYEIDPRLVRDLHIDEIEPEWATRHLVPSAAIRSVR